MCPFHSLFTLSAQSEIHLFHHTGAASTVMAYEYDFQEWYQGLCEIPNDAKNFQMLAAGHHAALMQHCGGIPDSRNLPIENLMDGEDDDLTIGKRSRNALDKDSLTVSQDSSSFGAFESHSQSPSVLPNGRPVLSTSLSLEDYHHAALASQEEHFSLNGGTSSSSMPVVTAPSNTTAFRLLIEDDSQGAAISMINPDSSYDKNSAAHIADLYMLHMQTPTTIPSQVLESPMMFFNPNTMSAQMESPERHLKSYKS
jgi:hypothetical protein